MIRGYKDLIIWQRSMDLVETIYQTAANLPQTQQFELASQMRRSAVSPPTSLKVTAGAQRANTGIIFQ
jgi:four helix bundle protein